jgi:hypothetical protein
VIRGPCIHIPVVDEWTHEFEWHGTDPENKTKKVPRGLNFTKLRVIPDQVESACVVANLTNNIHICRCTSILMMCVRKMMHSSLSS